MGVNLLEMVKEVAGDALLKNASSLLGTSESNTKTAIGASIPTLLGSLIDKGSNEEGASSILNFINTNQLDGGILDNIGDLLGGGNATDGLAASGAGILKYLMGDKLASVVDMISKMSGIQPGKMSSLIKLVSPVLMSVVGKFVKNKALDAIGLKNLFGGQKKYVQEAMPVGIEELLGLTAFQKREEDKEELVATTAASSVEGTKSNIWPWVLGLVALLAAIFLLRKGCSDTSVGEAVSGVADQIEETADNAVDATKGVAQSIGDAINSITLPNGGKIEAKAGSFMDNLVQYVSGSENEVDRSFTFDNLKFNTASDQITAESQTQLDNLANVLSAYKDVQIRLEGHTDNTGDAAANKILSEDRAKSVKAYLIGKGIAGSRIEASGVGVDRPIADNNSDEGKRQNRRVELYVTAK